MTESDRELALESYNTIVLRSFSKKPGAKVGLAILVLIALMAVIGPWLTPYSPVTINPPDSMQPPSIKHPMGTDRFGRDVLSRVMIGARASLLVGFLAVAIGTTLGTAIGLFSAVSGGRVDGIVMRVMDLWFAFPTLLLALSIVAVLGPSLTNAVYAVGISTVPSYARLVRGCTLSVLQSTYVLAARATGASSLRIALRHVLPNVMAPIIVLSTFAIASCILTAAGLSFLGLGAQPPQPEWGADLSAGRNYLRQAWWISTLPGFAIMLVTVSINLVGDGLRDALDPRLKID